MNAGIRQFVIFALVGVANTTVHYCIFLLLLHAFAVPALIASGIGYCAGVANSYLLNRTFTFRQTGAATGGEFARFALINGVSLGINLGVMKLVLATTTLRPEFAQIVAIGASLLANFVGSRWWVFRGQGGQPVSAP
jgi:putative flippase GtrA